MKIYLKDILFIIAFMFIVSTIYILINNDEKKDYSNVKIVDNSTQYYDVVGIVNKFVHYSNESNKESIIKLLDGNFVSQKRINTSNIFKYVNKYSDSNISFVGEKMYYEKISKNINKFYVYGMIEKNSMDSYETVSDYYIIVLVDYKNSSFAIVPDNGKTFKEVEQWILN